MTTLMALFEAEFAGSCGPAGRPGAQIAACRIGAERYDALLTRWGRDTVHATVVALMDYAERLTRAEIGRIPDGDYSFTDWLDDDGGNPPSEALPFTVTVGVRGTAIHFDFTGTAAEVATAINNVPGSTLATCYFAVRVLTGDRAPNNDGCYRPITANVPESTMVNPRFPAPVGARSASLGRIMSTVHGAMARAAPIGSMRATTARPHCYRSAASILPQGNASPASSVGRGSEALAPDRIRTASTWAVRT